MRFKTINNYTNKGEQMYIPIIETFTTFAPELLFCLILGVCFRIFK